MGKKTAKPSGAFDCIVVGDHPSASFAAALLAEKSIKKVGLISMPCPGPQDRLVTLNPALFKLHSLLEPVEKQIPADPVHGLDFLSDEPGIRGEYRIDRPVISVARYTDVRSAFAGLTDDLETIRGDGFKVDSIDPDGVDLTIGRRSVRTRAMIFANEPDRPAAAALAIPDHWDADLLRRFTVVRCKTEKNLTLPHPRTMPMSLNVGNSFAWGRVLVGVGGMMLVIDEPESTATSASGRKLMRGWVDSLKRHQILEPAFDFSKTESVTFPLAGALHREGVASRSLLIGPAGGFYSHCGEEIYPGCWSAMFAVESLVKALKETHLQDALHGYRQKWPVTLGEYLRGPQQNLRFLLPMVYKNAAMTTRIAEAILLSKPVVR